MFEEALVARLLAAAAVRNIVGNRVTWLERPRAEALPALTLQMVSQGRGYSHEGATGLSDPRVQVDSWGATYLDAKRAARAALATLEPAATVGGVRFDTCFSNGGPDMPPEEITPGGKLIYRVLLDLTISWEPA